MREYDFRTFVQYYHRAWVEDLTNPGRSVMVYSLDDDSIVGVRPMTANVHRYDLEEAVPISYTDLEWKHVRRPSLGYRHLSDGMQLVYAEGRSGRVPKGLQQSRVHISVPPQFRAAVLALPKPFPLNHTILNAVVADAYRFPEYVSMEDAIKRLTSEPQAMGFALNSQAAVCLGRTADRPFILLFDGDEVASSMDGVEWTPVSPELNKIVDYCKALEV